MGTWDWELSSVWFTISIWPHHVGAAGCSTRRTLIRRCSKDSAFPSPCSYSVLLVLPKKEKKKKWKVLMFLKFLKRPWKRSYCSELRWKAKALKTLERLKSKEKKIKCILVQRTELALHAWDGSFIRPGSNNISASFSSFNIKIKSFWPKRLNISVSKHQNGLFWKLFYDTVFKLKDYLEPATSEWTTSHWSS